MRIVHTEFFILTMLLSSMKFSSPASSPRRERSRSPSSQYRDSPIRLPFSDVLGYRFDQLPFIRLSPIQNLHWRFELRRYFFTADKRIKLLEGNGFFPPVPPQEHIVLSTTDGDVFAILRRSDTLAGLFKYFHPTKRYKRIKINMESGRITQLTPCEIEEVPVGEARLIQYFYKVEHVNQSGRLPSHVETGVPYSSSSHPALPFSNVLGYGIHQLPFIRLCYKENPHRLFELRRYTFPVDKPIKIRTEKNRYGQIPIEEQIVLSTVGGDVFAILASSDAFAGIYGYNPETQRQGRAKINMRSSRISSLSPVEIKEVPVGPRHEIRHHYIVDLMNQTSSQQ